MKLNLKWRMVTQIGKKLQRPMSPIEKTFNEKFWDGYKEEIKNTEKNNIIHNIYNLKSGHTTSKK